MRQSFALLIALLGLFSSVFLISENASAEPVRLLLTAGHDNGLAAERALQYADTDAARVRDVLVQMGGVKPENAQVLTEPTPEKLFEAIDRMKAEAEKHPPEEVTIIFYFSGHGDREAIHLGDARVPISDLSARLQRIPASLRIVVTDACRSSRDKGMSVEPAFPISLGALPQAHGSVWLNAASDGEAAQESDELQGAIFTHAWLNGLRGAADSNGDSRVTLEESFAFAHSQTLLRSAKSSGVLQKPEAVMSLTETTPVVLTQTAARLSVLSLPPSADTHYLVYASGAKSVLAEIWGAPDRRTALAVPPGRYVIHRRIASHGGLAQISLGQGEERQLEAPDFSAASLESLARKGGSEGEAAVDPDKTKAPELDVDKRHAIIVGMNFGTNAHALLLSGPAAAPLMEGPSAAYMNSFGHWSVTVGGSFQWANDSSNERALTPYARVTYNFSHWAIGLGGGFDMANGDTSTGTAQTLTPYLRAMTGPRWKWGSFSMRIDGGFRAGYAFQTLSRNDASAIEAGGYAGTTSSSALVWGPELSVGVRYEFNRGRPGWFMNAEIASNASIFREADSEKFVPGVNGVLGAGVAF